MTWLSNEPGAEQGGSKACDIYESLEGNIS